MCDICESFRKRIASAQLLGDWEKSRVLVALLQSHQEQTCPDNRRTPLRRTGEVILIGGQRWEVVE